MTTTQTSGAATTGGELYEAAFSTTGPHPQCGVALTRSITEARQRLADMPLLIDPRQPAIADITQLLRGHTVQTYHGTTGDIFAQVNDNDEPVPYTVTARPLTTRRPPDDHHHAHPRSRDFCWGQLTVVHCRT